MGDIVEIVLSEEGPEVKDLKEFLIAIDSDFRPSLSSKVCLETYANKLKANAFFVLAFINDEIVGITVFYANDLLLKNSYLPIIGVKEKYRGQGIALKMLKALLSYLEEKGFEKLSLETWQGSPAQYFYQKNNFVIDKIVEDRGQNTKSVKMFRWLGEISSELDSFYTTRLEYHNNLSLDLGVNLFIKRDDLYPKFGGGNKARKLDFILNKARNGNYNAIVTAGGAQSNHCRATALYAKSLGWKTILIIHDNEPEIYQGNLKLMKLAGANIRFVKHKDVKIAMDQAMEELQEEGYNPFYIWGGGHTLEGSLAYFNAVKELKFQLGNITPDYLIVASGTGGTQAGIEVGIRKLYPTCRVIGVSVAREESRGKKEVYKSIKELNEYLNKPISIPDAIHFNTEKCGEGYETVFPELLDTINNAISRGLILDPTYTGKAFHALKCLIKDNVIEPNSNVVFWHTGGLMNLINSTAI